MGLSPRQTGGWSQRHVHFGSQDQCSPQTKHQQMGDRMNLHIHEMHIFLLRRMSNWEHCLQLPLETICVNRCDMSHVNITQPAIQGNHCKQLSRGDSLNHQNGTSTNPCFCPLQHHCTQFCFVKIHMGVTENTTKFDG